MNLEIGQIIAQIVAFLVTLWILQRYAWNPLLKLMDERRANIRGEFEQIEAAKKEIETLRASYEQKISGAQFRGRSTFA